MSCQFKDIFGKPGEGVHSYRIFGMAAVDLFLTILGALLISWKTDHNFLLVFGVLFIVGEIFHWMFCVDTAVIKFFSSQSLNGELYI